MVKCFQPGNDYVVEEEGSVNKKVAKLEARGREALEDHLFGNTPRYSCNCMSGKKKTKA